MPSTALDYITVKGFKSITSVEKLQLRPVNVLIGSNGSGKSNFIGVFAFLHAIREGRLRRYVVEAGGAEKVLGCLATMMVDFYGMPGGGDRAWPGRAAAARADSLRKAPIVEAALANDLAEEAGQQIDSARFIPFVVVHEFEGLLFCDCGAFAHGIGRTDLEPQFRQIRDAFATPEDINDSPDTCPSKRVTNLVPGYEKPLLGTLAALEIGLARIRAACPHFAEWLNRLESRV